MATLTHVGDKYLVFAMNWNTVKNTKKDLRSVASLGKKFDAAYKVALVLSKTVSFGFINHTGTLTRSPRKGELLSGAALFSAGCADSAAAILVLRLEESKRAAIVAIEDGKPYLDVVVSISQVETRLKSLFAETGTSSRQWDLFTNWPEQFVGAFKPEAEASANDERFNSAEEISADDLKKQASKNAILTKFVDNRATNSAITVVLLIVLLMLGKVMWEKEQRRREREMADANAINPLVVYQQKIQQLLPTLGFPGSSAKESLLDTLLFRTTEIAGWRINDVTCLRNGACTEQWSVQHSGTSASFAEANKIGKPRFAADGTKITNVYQLPTKPTRLEQQKLPGKEAFWVEFTTLLQQMRSIGMVYSIGQPALLDGDNTLAVPPGTGVLAGKFSIGGPLGLAGDALSALPGNVAIDSIKLDTSGDLSNMRFEIKGNFYVKN